MLNSILPPPKQSYSSAPREVQQQKAPLNVNSLIPLNNSTKNKSENFSVLGRHDKKVVYGSSKDLVAYNPEVERTRPSEEEEFETTQRTKAALEKILNGKITASHPSKPADNNREITYFQYTPNADNATPNVGSKQRVVKLVEVQQDPLNPPKFKHQKVARGPGSPPVPIMHSPPRKLTQQDVADWQIPSCISNWKNQKGYTISLDKRLAADGRGLQKPQINDKFAVFSESLYLAERNAREMVESRLQIKEKLLQKQRKQKEEALTELAKNARMERSKIVDEEEDDDVSYNEKRERDRLREDRRKQTEREMRLENLVSSKKKKRDEDRDVSEAIALGKAVPKVSTGEGMFDQRLFNQTQGISQGFGADDSYNVYDKPLFHGSAATQLFRPKKSEVDPYSGEEDLEKLKQGTAKFRPDKGFAGTQTDKPVQPRNKPVQFEKDDYANDAEDYEDDHQSSTQQPQDEFGLDEFLDDVKRGKGSVILPGDRRGTLHASSTSSVSSSDRQSSRNIQFTGQSANPPSHSAPHKSFESKSSSNYKLSDKRYNNNNNNDDSPPSRRSNRRSRSPSPRRHNYRSRSPSPRRSHKRSPSPRRHNHRSRSPSPRRYTKKSPSPRRSYKRSPSPRRSYKRSRSPPRRSHKRSRSPSPHRSHKRQNINSDS